MAHEVAHVTQRHIARQFAATSKNQYKTIAAIVAGLLLGGQAGQAAIAAGIASEAQRQINYTRANEYEADRIGLRLLADAGYQPSGMSEFFDILLSESGVSADAVPEYLRTHPLESNRIAETAARAEQATPRACGGTPSSSTCCRHGWRCSMRSSPTPCTRAGWMSRCPRASTSVPHGSTAWPCWSISSVATRLPSSACGR